jgi:hypothetical protein
LFDHRLGLALHKDLEQVRAMPYRVWWQWRLYEMLEPFGWSDQEYRTAALLAMLYNANRGKGKARDVKDFTRDMLKAILKALDETTPPDLSQLSKEQIVALVKRDFGIK